MHYEIRLRLGYDYQHSVADARHLVRVLPRGLPGVQAVEAARLEVTPAPDERSDFDDFFGNPTTAIALRTAHDAFEVRMQARVRVRRAAPCDDRSPDLDGLVADLAAVRSLAADSPHHFLPPSDRVRPLARITDYARPSLREGGSVLATVQHLGRRLRSDFAYDPEATEVDTPLAQAFDMRAGVCQDFSHIMIAGLRGLGIPAGYVSGFLRTIPPPGQPRLEGADATHAWVRAWCGEAMGWHEFDPTNGVRANTDHITLAWGRDFSDVSPLRGVIVGGGQHQLSVRVAVTGHS